MLGGLEGTAGGEAGWRLLLRGLAEKGGRIAAGGGEGCSAGGTTAPLLLPCCRRDASGPGAAEEAVPARFSESSVVTEAVDPVSVGRSDRKMHRCESVGRLDLAAVGSLPPSKSLLLYLVRMGSFTSAPKIANEDQADCDLEMEPQRPVTREELLARCRQELQSLPPQLKRNFTGRYQEHPGPETVRVLQWNLLSQALAEQADGFACCPDAALDWSKRRWRILEEILSYQPDVVCLQEVDHYKFLSASLGSVGFDGTFYPKPDSPCCYVRGNNGPDGCAIFYDRTKFELVRCEKRVLEVFTCQSNQVTLLCIFRRKLDDAELCIVTTHLKARQGGLLSSLRNEQGKDLLDFVRAHRGNRPVIIAGDFNAEPSEPVYRTLMAQRDLPLESSYAVRPASGGVREQEPPYTTWKIRREGEVCHTIDYIFYTKPDFQLESRLDLPTEDQIGPGRVPSLAYASDHFSLVADLALPFRISDQQVNELLNEGSHHGTAS